MLRDVALLVLALLTVAAALYVVSGAGVEAPVRDALDTDASAVSEPPSAADPATVRALFIGDEVVGEANGSGLAALTGEALGWEVSTDSVAGTGFLVGPAGQTYADRAPAALAGSAADVVVIVGSPDPGEEADGRLLGGNAQFVLGAVRDALPGARVVLVGPIGVTAEAASAQGEVLLAVAARFGAVFVDPVSAGYLTERPELLDEQGALTSVGVQEVARRLADDLRRVLPAPLLPTPTPTPS